MADKVQLCSSIRLLSRMADAYSVYLENPKAAELEFKPVVMEMITHFNGLKGEKPGEFGEFMSRVTTVHNLARYGDPGSSNFLKVMELLRSKIHQSKPIRNFFLGSDEHSDELYGIMQVLEEGDVSDAIPMLDDLHKKVTCTTL